MATAILHSLKHGAYTAIALYVVFIAVATVASMNPQLTASTSVSTQSTLVEVVRTPGESKASAS